MSDERKVSKTRLDECVDIESPGERYLDIKALMYELGVEITPRTKPAPQPIEKTEFDRVFISEWLEKKWSEDWCDPSYFPIILGWFIELLERTYKPILQQKPEIDKKYVEEKARKIGRRITAGAPLNAIKDEITQIISDVRGGNVELTRSNIDKFILLFKTTEGEERKIIIDRWIEYLEKAGVKIK